MAVLFLALLVCTAWAAGAEPGEEVEVVLETAPVHNDTAPAVAEKEEEEEEGEEGEEGEGEGETHFAPCKMLARWNRRTGRHDHWCIPVPGWDEDKASYKDEGLADYRDKGFHPVALDEELGPGYRVERKVAHGTFATVWQVRAPRPMPLAPDGVVVKIMKASARRMAQDELDVYHMLQDPGHPNVMQLLDDFVIDGPFGKHQALVFPLMGVDMERSRWTGPAEAKIVARALMHALKYVHEKNFMHADVKMENILFTRNNTDVVLADFGGSYPVTDTRQGRTIQSREYRSPEILLGAPYSEKIDIWSVGCIVFEVATRKVLFPPKWGDKHEKNVNHLRLISKIMGPFPPAFARSGIKSDEFFDEKGELIGGIPERVPISKLLREEHSIEDVQLVEFLSACLKIDPRFRPSAAEFVDMYDYVKDTVEPEVGPEEEGEEE